MLFVCCRRYCAVAVDVIVDVGVGVVVDVGVVYLAPCNGGGVRKCQEQPRGTTEAINESQHGISLK